MQEYDQKLFVRIADAMLRKVDCANVPQLVKCCSAFTRLGFRDDRLLFVLSRRVRKLLKEDMLATTNLSSSRRDKNHDSRVDGSIPVAADHYNHDATQAPFMTAKKSDIKLHAVAASDLILAF